jgi:hypothetical protein
VIQTNGVTPSPGGEDYIQFNKEINELRQQYQPGATLPEKLAARSTAIPGTSKITGPLTGKSKPSNGIHGITLLNILH